MNPPYVHAAHQTSGYSNNAVDPYPARSPVGVDGVSIGEHRFSLSNSRLNKVFLGQTSPNPQITRMGNRNPEMTGQQLPTPVPALHRSLSSQRSSSGQGWNTENHGASVSGVQGQQYIQGAPTGSSRCRLPDCRQPRFFDNRIQELLDYCEPHLAYVSLLTMHYPVFDSALQLRNLLEICGCVQAVRKIARSATFGVL